MNWCDPCAADPLSVKELRELGVFWLKEGKNKRGSKSAARNFFVMRLHVRCDGEHFSEDLIFQQTSDRKNFQARYVLCHPRKGKGDCQGAEGYRRALLKPQENEA